VAVVTTTPEVGLPAPLVASVADLPAAVAAALAEPSAPRSGRVAAAGIAWATVEWGDPADRPVLLVHGVTSSSATWWRVGPALAAGGFRVVAVDQAGHGATGTWLGHHRFADNAADVAAFVRAAGLSRADLAVVGHSWGALTVAALPSVGIRPAVLVLVDPPAVPRDVIAEMLESPTERRYDDLDDAVRAVRTANPTWTEGDVIAKARALTEFDEQAVRDVLLDNDWDGGLAGLADPAARDVPVWVIRGEPAAGSYVAAAAVPAVASRVGPARLVTIAGGPHSPQRTHPEATLVALLRALDGSEVAGLADPDRD
jgi:pimeloyl-ACP methyl ester carboxylesterase